MGAAPASGLLGIPMAVPMGWPQPPSYQVSLQLFLWGGPSLGVTKYSYGYPYGFAYGVAPAYELPTIFLWLFLWGGPSLTATSCSFGYSYWEAPASKLPGITAAIPMEWPQPPIYKVFPWFFLWGGPSLRVTRHSDGYSYAVARGFRVTKYSYDRTYG